MSFLGQKSHRDMIPEAVTVAAIQVRPVMVQVTIQMTS